MSDYVLDFRSIDPSRRFCASRQGMQFVHGFNTNQIGNAPSSIPTEYIEMLKEGFNGLNKLSFFIKPYQRGFRWDAKNNVRVLLDDLFSYSEANSGLFEKTRINYLLDFSDIDFYCLQTLTVKNLGNANWEVIDGQQRLTCVFLIYMVLSYFCGRVNTPYEIIYEREGKSFSLSETISKYFKKLPEFSTVDPRDVLQNEWNNDNEKNQWFEDTINHVEELFRNENHISGSYDIDSYYVRNAMVEIFRFVSEGKDQTQINTLLECIKRNIFFLWYVVPEDIELSSEDVFLKINSGAIPLTNAELVKSLVLRSDRNDVKYMSRKWEEMERGLSSNELWAFMAGNYESDTRIDLLLDVFAINNADEGNLYHGVSSNNPYALFDWYNEYGKKTSSSFAENILNALKDEYDRILEWYEDVEIYHYIGLLTLFQKLGFRFDKSYRNQQELLRFLLIKSDEVASKADFIKYLKKCIIDCLKMGLKKDQKDIKVSELVNTSETLNYLDDKKRVEAILWLLNVCETVESNDNKVIEKKNNKIISTSYKEYICRRFPFSEALSGGWSLEHIFPQHPEDNDTAGIEEYNAEVENLPSEKRLKEDDVHYIYNMALLDKNLNTSLQNRMLCKKRSKLIEEIGKGSFVPPSTINAFMLYYDISSSDVDDHISNNQIGDDWNYWTINDADHYLKAIIDCIKRMEGLE